MPLPEEIKRAQEVYRGCRFYRDHAEIQQIVDKSILLKWSSHFSTDFERDTSLQLAGATQGPVAPPLVSSSNISPHPSVGKWTLTYDYKNFIYRNESDAIRTETVMPSSEAILQARSSSLGAVNLIPYLLLEERNTEAFWKAVETYKFATTTDDFGNSICFGERTDANLEVSIDQDGKILHINWIERNVVEPEHLQLLRQSLERFEEPSSPAAIATRQTLELLGSQETFSETVTTCRFIDPAVIT
ncbi:hypothetical protein BH10CYA1_BH10CYA1_58430 [soil metagenome]